MMKLIVSAKEDLIKDFSKAAKIPVGCCLLTVCEGFLCHQVAPELGEEFHTKLAMHQI
jgi:hypothetical protein